jgi:NADH-quinone oxidoreductase subunit C
VAGSTRGAGEIEEEEGPATRAKPATKAAFDDWKPTVGPRGKALDSRLASLISLISEKFPEAKVYPRPTNAAAVVEMKTKERFVEFCEYIYRDLKFDHSSLISGVDWLTHLEVVYHWWSTHKRVNIILKVSLDRENPSMPSVMRLWKSANYHERETYDMMGVKFEGHPDLRRVYLEENYEFFPQRKDFRWGLKYG